MGLLRHLNVTVCDIDRSIAFYARWFGFDRELARYPDGTVFVTDGAGFELAFHAGEATANPGWHFGFTYLSRQEVLELCAQLAAAGISPVDIEDTPSYVGFKCEDPDGYWIEAYYEPRSDGCRP